MPGSPLSGNPDLGTLANNGGPTETMALLSGSPAIGAGVAVTGITTDERGYPRPAVTPDIGAYQHANSYTITVNDPVDELDNPAGDSASQLGAQVSLRDAINAAENTGGTATIDFATNLAGKQIALSSTLVSNPAGASSLPDGTTAFVIGGSSNITINGAGAPGLTINGGGAVRLFDVTSGASLTLENLTLAGGNAVGGSGGNSGEGGGGGGAGLGGGVYDDGGTFLALGCTFTNNTAQGGKGGNGDFGDISLAGAGGGANGGDRNAGAGGFAGGGGGGSVGNGGPGGFGGGGGGASSQAGGAPGFGGGRGGNGYSAGGGGGAGLGGGVFMNGGTLTLTNDTFTANTATGGGGGSGNSNRGANGSGFGGAVFALNGTVNATFDTFSGNTAAQGGTDIYLLGDSTDSGVRGTGQVTATIVDSILGQGGPSTVSDFVTGTYNGGTGAAITANNNLVTNNPAANAGGLPGSPLSGNPDLSSLANNGGPTQTMALLPGSPAIGAGAATDYPGTSTPITTDQRSEPRPFEGAYDIGAYQYESLFLVVTTASDAAVHTGTSLRDAVATANADAKSGISATITFASDLAGDTITLTQGVLELGAGGAGSGVLAIYGANQITVSGGGTSGVFEVDAGVTATLTGLTVEDGTGTYAGDALYIGGGIWDQGTLTLTGSTITGNTASDGGGVYVGAADADDTGATLTVNGGSTISDNTATSAGGGIYSYYLATVTISGDSLITGNNAAGYYGGGIYSYDGYLSITNSSVTDNGTSVSPVYDGGGIFSEEDISDTLSGASITGNYAEYGGGIYLDEDVTDASSVTIENSTSISDNSASNSGGGVYSYYSTATVSDSQISGNTAEYGGGYDNYNDGSSGYSFLTVNQGSTFSDNNATYDGGGIYNYYGATVTITGSSTVVGNSAGDYGGGIYSYDAYVTLTGAMVNDNGTSANPVDDGGGIYSKNDDLVITGSNISGNYGDYGGGLYSYDDYATVQGSTISGNTAEYGGGVFTYDYTYLTVTGSTVSGNTATAQGGGVYNTYESKTTVTDSTVTGNSAADGGGFYNYPDGYATLLTLSNVTVSGNSATGVGGGIHDLTGGTVNLVDTIVAGNTAASDADDDEQGTLTATDSLIGDGTSTGLANGVDGNLVGTTASPINPELAALATNNGAAVQTMALEPSSPAILAGGPVTTLTAAISPEAQSIPVADLAVPGNVFYYTAGTYLIQIGSEQILLTATDGGTSFTATRGYGGTTPAQHNIGDAVIFAQDEAGQSTFGSPDIGAYEFQGLALSTGPAVTYTVGSAAGPPVALVPNAVFQVRSGDLSGATLAVSEATTYSGDQFNFATGGPVSVSSGTIEYSGTPIATVTGAGTAALTITFDSNATQAEAQAVIQDLTFVSAKTSPVLASRSVLLKLTDGASNPGSLATQTVTIVGSPPPAGSLLAYDGFSTAAGPLEGDTDGSGWNTNASAGTVGWYVQNLSASVPGYQINSASMAYPGLQTSGGSAGGGSSYLTAGRRLDTTTTFAPYDVPGTKQIGASGTTLWFSVVVDRQTAVGGGQSPTSVDFTNNNVEWLDSSAQFGVGYYGSASDSAGKGYWSLMVGGTVVQSTTPITVGAPALLVLEMNFTGAGDTFSLFVNPGSLGGAAPALASATGAGTGITFSSVVYNAGATAGVSTMDELRIGTTFSAVTPATGSKPAPTLTLTDAGGAYNTSPFPATDSINSGSVLEGVTPSLLYYSGTSSTGTALGGAPSAAGTYTAVASFAGSTDYSSAAQSVTFSITQVAPKLTLADANGPYDDAPFTATATIAGVGNQSAAAASLEGQALILTYYTLSPSSSSSTAPSAAGTYLVVATFAGSTDYAPLQDSVLFTISQVAPTITVTDLGGTGSGSPFPATGSIAGVGGQSTAGSSLESVPLVLTYYSGANATGTPLGAAPSAVGTYAVLASFAGSTDYASGAASTVFTINSASTGSLLAYDGFTGAAGPLQGDTDGSGWNTTAAAGAVGWSVQNNSTSVPGYQVNAGGLAYPGLQTSGGSASGGSSYLTAGRRLDTTTAFAPYDVPGTRQIGASGTTLWFSVVLDRQTAVGGGQPATSVDFTNSSVEWLDNSAQFGVGYYGASSDSGGKGYWSLMVGGTVVKSTTPITVGTPALLVLEMSFSGGGDSFSLFVNPVSLGGTAPGTASASQTGRGITFSSIVYNAGATSGVSTMDELRVGTSYAIVTPPAGGGKPVPSLTVSDNGGTYNTAPFAATDSINGGSSLEGVTPSLAYYSGTSATGTPLGGAPSTVGTYTVSASFPGTADYASASQSITFSITKAAPALTLTDAGGTFTGSAFPASDTVAGVGSQSAAASSLEGVTPSLAYYSGTGATGTPLGTAPTALGTYTVVASFAGSTDYSSGSTSTIFAITNGSLPAPTLTVTDNGGAYYDGPFPATATVNGGGSLESVSPSLLYYSGTAATGTPLGGAPTAAGTYTAVASFAGSTDYSSAVKSVIFSITKATPTVNLTDNGGTYNGSAFAAIAAIEGVDGQAAPASSLEGVTASLTYYSGTGATGTPLGGAPTAAGTYTVLASFAGSTDYASSSTGGTFSITRVAPTVNVTDASGTYTGSAFTATATVAGIGSQSTPASSLEGVTPALTYYSGTSTTGTVLSGAPTALGTYTVLASFAGSTDYTSGTATAPFLISPAASGSLLAYDGFTGPAGSLEGDTDGSGWNTTPAAGTVGWYVQNLSTSVPGYQVNAASLAYSNLQNSGGSAAGGSAYLTAGRRLDTTTTFAPYDVPGTKQIGASGTTLWFSVLVDRQTAVGGGQSPTSVDFTNNSVEWLDSSPQFGVGYYGSASDSAGKGYWSLMVGGTVVKSTTAVTVGTPALLVLEMSFTGAGDTFSLFVNPGSLGGTAPAVANATQSGTGVTFSNIVYNAGATSGVSTIDELRLGTSFAAVTPTTVVPTVQAPDTATSPAVSPFQNQTNPLDVLGTGGPIVPGDALAVINYLNAHPGGALSTAPSGVTEYLDVLGTGTVTPADALVIINYLNAHPADAEQTPAVTPAVTSPAAGAGNVAVAVTVAAGAACGGTGSNGTTIGGTEAAASTLASEDANAPSTTGASLAVSPAVLAAAQVGGSPAIDGSADASANLPTGPAAQTTLSRRQWAAVDALVSDPSQDWLDL